MSNRNILFIVFLCLSGFLILFTGCNPPGETDPEFVGTWVLSARAPTIVSITLSTTEYTIMFTDLSVKVNIESYDEDLGHIEGIVVEDNVWSGTEVGTTWYLTYLISGGGTQLQFDFDDTDYPESVQMMDIFVKQ